MPHAALWVVQLLLWKILFRFRDVSMPHAALWVVQRFWIARRILSFPVSMPHAALWVVQRRFGSPILGTPRCFNAARGFVGGAARCRGACRTLCAGVSMPHAAIPFRPYHRFAVPLPRSRRGGFSFTARQLLSPIHRTRTAAKSRLSVKGYGILASPADAGERSTSANHTSFYSCSWDVFPYDLFPVQLCPMGLLLGQVSKWRAQRADGGAHAARGFVGGAAVTNSTPSVSLVSFNAARGFVGGATEFLP